MTPLQNLDARLGTWLGQMELGAHHRPGGVTALRVGDALVLITVFANGDEAWCRLSAPIAVDAEPSLPLLYRVLALNNEVVAGAFRLFDDRSLWFTCTLPGAAVDADTFANVLQIVGATADEHSEALVALANARSGPAMLEELPCG